jgi:hypothetical protein
MMSSFGRKEGTPWLDVGGGTAAIYIFVRSSSSLSVLGFRIFAQAARDWSRKCAQLLYGVQNVFTGCLDIKLKDNSKLATHLGGDRSVVLIPFRSVTRSV